MPRMIYILGINSPFWQYSQDIIHSGINFPGRKVNSCSGGKFWRKSTRRKKFGGKMGPSPLVSSSAQRLLSCRSFDNGFQMFHHENLMCSLISFESTSLSSPLWDQVITFCNVSLWLKDQRSKYNISKKSPFLLKLVTFTNHRGCCWLIQIFWHLKQLICNNSKTISLLKDVINLMKPYYNVWKNWFGSFRIP